MTKIKNKDLIKLWHSLAAVGSYPHTKFNYSIEKNKNAIRGEFEALSAAEKKIQELLTPAEETRIKICEKYAKKDPKGAPIFIMKDGKRKYDIDESAPAFKKEIDKLNKDFKAVKETVEKQYKEFEKLLDVEVNVDLYMIKYDPEKNDGENIPKDCREIASLLPIIEEIK